MNGYCTALVEDIQNVAEGNAPGRKIHPSGFLQMLFCCQNSSVSPLQQAYEGGHERPLTVAYRQRPLLSHVDDEDNCEINRIPAKAEWNIPALLFRKTSFFLSDSEIAKYCQEASRGVRLGNTGIMAEHYGLFVEHANILMRAVNIALATEMSTKFGENVRTGLATPATINIAKSAELDLNAGIVRFLADLRDNEICDSPCMVGAGLMANYSIANLMQCCSAAGVDPSRLGLPRLQYDREVTALWGANPVGVFAPGSVKLITRDNYVGDFAGAKGGSIFFNVAFPVQEFDGCPDPIQCLRDLSIDVQMKYIDCPTEIDVAGVPTTVNRGWQVILSKRFALWVQPTSAYAAGDPLADTNGTLLYTVTNV